MRDSMGSLTPTILVDNPKRVHYGHRDHVTGRIAVRYDALKNSTSVHCAPIVGPLRVLLTLSGRAKVDIHRRYKYDSDVPLLNQVTMIHDGPFECSAGESREFPFEIAFPKDIHCHHPAIGSRTLVSQPVTALPPSVFSNESSFGEGAYEASIQYRLTVDMFMKGVKVKINKPVPLQAFHGSLEELRCPTILYERPQLRHPMEDKSRTTSSTISISNENLLNGIDRPTGFRQKAKGKALAVLSEDHFPKYTFEWTWTGSEFLYLTRPATFTLRIKPKESECTAPSVPEIHLKSCIVHIEGITKVVSDEHTLAQPEQEGRRKTQLKCIADDGPFSKVNDWTKTVTTEPLIGMPSSFAFINMSRRYVIHVELLFSLAGTEKESKAIYPITLLPPPIRGDDIDDSIAGSSLRAQVLTPLPLYEPPPGYFEIERDS